MLRVRDIMTCDVLQLTPQTTIREAMEALSTNHISGAPVVSGGRVTGVISMTDILGFLISAPANAQTRATDDGEREWTEPTGEDAEFESEAQSAALDDDLWDEWTKGSEARVDDASPEGEGLLDQRIVEEAMNDEVFAVAPGASVRSAAGVMHRRGIHRVLVMDGQRLVGIVSSLDIARAVAQTTKSGSTRITCEPVHEAPSL